MKNSKKIQQHKKKNHESLMEQVISRRSTLYTVQRYTEHQNSGHPGVTRISKNKNKKSNRQKLHLNNDCANAQQEFYKTAYRSN